MLGASPHPDELALLPWQANEVVAEVKRKQEKKEKKKKKREKRRLEALAAAAEEMEDSVEAEEAEVRAGARGGCLSGRGCGRPAVRGAAGPCPAGFVGALGPPKKTAQPPHVREAACMDLAFVSSPGWTQPIYLRSVSLQENDTEPVKKKKKKKEQESLSEPEENGLEEDALPKKKRKLTGEAAQLEKKKKKAAKDLEED